MLQFMLVFMLNASDLNICSQQTQTFSTIHLDFEELLINLILLEDRENYMFIYKERSMNNYHHDKSVIVSQEIMLQNLIKNIISNHLQDIHPLYRHIIRLVYIFLVNRSKDVDKNHSLPSQNVKQIYNIFTALNLIEEIIHLSDNEKCELLNASGSIAGAVFYNIDNKDKDKFLTSVDNNNDVMITTFSMAKFVKELHIISNQKKLFKGKIFVNFRFFELIVDSFNFKEKEGKNSFTFTDAKEWIFLLYEQWIMSTIDFKFEIDKKGLNLLRWFTINNFRSIYISTYGIVIIYSRAYSIFRKVLKFEIQESNRLALIIVARHQKAIEEFTHYVNVMFYECCDTIKILDDYIQTKHHVSIYKL